MCRVDAMRVLLTAKRRAGEATEERPHARETCTYDADRRLEGVEDDSLERIPREVDLAVIFNHGNQTPDRADSGAENC